MRRLGYAATDYVLIAALIIAVVTPFLFVSVSPLRGSEESKLQNSLDEVQAVALRLNRLNDFSADRAIILWPKGVVANDKIVDNVVTFTLGTRQFVYQFNPAIKIEGDLRRLGPGRQFVDMQKIGNRIVLAYCGNNVREGSEQCDGAPCIISRPGFPSILRPCGPPVQIGECRCSCTNNNECPLGSICKPDQYCGPCSSDSECSLGDICLNGRCGRETPAQPRCPYTPCTNGNICEETSGTCVAPCTRSPDRCEIEYGPGWVCNTNTLRCSPPTGCANGECGRPGCTCPQGYYCDISRLPQQCVSCRCDIPGCPTCPAGQDCISGACVPGGGCTGNNDCPSFPFEVCNTATRTCEPCKIAPDYCGPGRSCRKTDALGQNGVCGDCDTNSDCPISGQICDPLDKNCKGCYWGYYQCPEGQVCINDRCEPVGGPRAPMYGCGAVPPGAPPGTVACDPNSCLQPGEVCMRQGGGCRCVSFARWWRLYQGAVPPPGRPDPAAPGPGQQPQGNPQNTPGTTPGSGCRYNPFATLTPGDTTGRSLCTAGNTCGSNEECVLTGPASCACLPLGSISYFEQLWNLGITSASPIEDDWVEQNVVIGTVPGTET